ncbi:type I-E CRISPR-associated protein Cse2/CasB [Rhodanobacter sp. Root561]|uniref:type I-E CRISPR-associated protein Cse2/CasB n=1 Tax=Rhodanobacter sp. Root561 TaxID=1736560 RepID=UPI0006FBDC85|nr:type I-E CRISPR-associated protein Cse2/CasB [Rhodanobacter sp. Root561]KQZ79506.1 type I-E CRISPR-associated protein Cse2/CasB [Rhodanobacter sp. Root561]
MEIAEKDTPAKIGKEAGFVAWLIARCQEDKGLAARLQRADNPATEYQCWETLANWVDLENEAQRLPFATVAAAIARAKPSANGSVSLGRAIARCFDDGSQSDQAKARLRRLLACDELPELCRVLRPLLSLAESRVTQPLDHARVLRQLVDFGRAAGGGNAAWLQRIKAQWAQEFYGQKIEAEAGEGA